MSDHKSEVCTRRSMLARTAMFTLGGMVGCATGIAAQEQSVVAEAPPLPWKWVELDPLETGRRAYLSLLIKAGFKAESVSGGMLSRSHNYLLDINKER